MKKVTYSRVNSKDEKSYYVMEGDDQVRILNEMVNSRIKSVEPYRETRNGDVINLTITLDNGRTILICPQFSDDNGVDRSDEATLCIEYDGIGSVFQTEDEIKKKLGPDFLPEEVLSHGN